MRDIRIKWVFPITGKPADPTRLVAQVRKLFTEKIGRPPHDEEVAKIVRLRLKAIGESSKVKRKTAPVWTQHDPGGYQPLTGYDVLKQRLSMPFRK